MSNWNNLLWPLEDYETVFTMFTHSKIIMRCHMEKSLCGGRLSESIFEKCFPQIHQIADLQRRGEQFHFLIRRLDVKRLQFRNINESVDISNFFSYETLFTKYSESNTCLWGRVSDFVCSVWNMETLSVPENCVGMLVTEDQFAFSIKLSGKFQQFPLR